jgi:hypothetical protein
MALTRRQRELFKEAEAIAALSQRVRRHKDAFGFFYSKVRKTTRSEAAVHA